MARPKNLSTRVLVNIRRDMTEVTPKVIWQHEKPILEMLHGDGNITEVDPTKLDEGYSDKVKPELTPYNKTMDTPARPSTQMGLGFVFIGNADQEWQRLADVYGRHPEENILLVEKIYGRAQDKRLANILGEPRLEDLPDAQLRSTILAYGYAPEPHKDASLDEKQAAWAARAALNKMPSEELVKLAREVGVDIG
jgi:hypothetical protein